MMKFILGHTKCNPIAKAIITHNKSITWNELQKQIEQFQTEMLAISSPRLMLYLPNAAESIALILACKSLFADVILVSYYYSIEDAIDFMNYFSATHLITIKMIHI